MSEDNSLSSEASYSSDNPSPETQGEEEEENSNNRTSDLQKHLQMLSELQIQMANIITSQFGEKEREVSPHSNERTMEQAEQGLSVSLNNPKLPSLFRLTMLK